MDESLDGGAQEMSTVSQGLRSTQVLGNRIVYYDRGSGPVLVLVHGMFGDHLDWEPTLEPLARDFRMIAPDLPGFGDSDKPDCEYNSEFFLATLRQLLSNLGVEEATLVGNSFGGILSVLYALESPGQVRRLVLVSSGGMLAQTPEQVRLVLDRFTEERLSRLTPDVQEMMLMPIFARQSIHRDRYMAKQRAKLERVDRKEYGRSLARSAALAWPVLLLERLSEIRCPTLLLWGDKDSVFPLEVPRRALELLADGELVVMSNCGHIAQLDDPETFVAAVRAFMA